jgi:hypothetical protein
MKNIYFLKIDKPSCFVFNELTGFTLSDDYIIADNVTNFNYHIYITNEENPKINDWLINIFSPSTANDLIKCNENIINTIQRAFFNKIIFTTDKDLINDGIQSIDYDFLKFYINNIGYVFVKIERGYESSKGFVIDNSSVETNDLTYKIISPNKKIKHKYIGECSGNDGNGCYLDACGHDCGCFKKVLIY